MSPSNESLKAYAVYTKPPLLLSSSQEFIKNALLFELK